MFNSIAKLVSTIGIAALLGGIPFVASAGQNITGQEVRYVGTGWSAEGLYILTVASTTSQDGCGPRYMIEPTHPMIKTMTAMLLMAFQTGTKVELFVDGCRAPDTMKLQSVTFSK